jgi:hypothetical protein
MLRRVAMLLAMTSALAACSGGTPPPRHPHVPSPTTASAVTPSTPRTKKPKPVPSEALGTPVAGPTSAPASASCEQGWTTPDPGSVLWRAPLGVIKREMGIGGRLVVTDMRHFVGPESPPSDLNYLQDIERWYVKAYLRPNPGVRARWLDERRRFGDTLAAVAPYASHGFASPDWTGFQHETQDPTARRYPGIPGTWPGTPYDFVNGGAGLQIAGLPMEITGCLDGT